MTVPGGIPRLRGCRTGGIKPCVSAFGADQFGADQADRLPFFFMAFYFAINVGQKKNVKRHDAMISHWTRAHLPRRVCASEKCWAARLHLRCDDSRQRR